MLDGEIVPSAALKATESADERRRGPAGGLVPSAAVLCVLVLITLLPVLLPEPNELAVE